MNRFDISRGQVDAWTALAGAHTAGRVASTYLFHGPEGVGAWALALEFAALLNCESIRSESNDPSGIHPCGTCRTCRTIFNLNFEGLYPVVPIGKYKNLKDAIDLTNETLEQKRKEPFCLLDQSSPISIPIDLARDVRRRLATRPTEEITRVVLFYRMDLMRMASADALLKLIEEPPRNTVIILTAAQPEALLPTILSRARKVRLRLPPETLVVEYLTRNYKATETDAKLAARVCRRSLGHALEMIRGEETDGADRRAIGLLLFKKLMLESAPDLVAHMSVVMNFRDQGAAVELIHLWQSLIRDCAYFASTSDTADLVNVDFLSDIELIAPSLADPAVVQQMVATTKITLADLRLNVHIQPALVAMALKLKANMETGGKSVTFN